MHRSSPTSSQRPPVQPLQPLFPSSASLPANNHQLYLFRGVCGVWLPCCPQGTVQLWQASTVAFAVC
eukprot:5908786-Prorocentrum_lima.AAC.1